MKGVGPLISAEALDTIRLAVLFLRTLCEIKVLYSRRKFTMRVVKYLAKARHEFCGLSRSVDKASR